MNKVIIVTGASRGIGRAIAIQLTNSGYEVHGVYNTSIKDAEALSAEHGIVFHKANLSKRKDT